MIGGGAGGVELMLSVRARLLRRGGADADFSFALVTADEILGTHNARVRAAFRRILAERDIALHERRKVRAVTADRVDARRGGTIAADAVLVTTDAAPPPWFEDTGLARDDGGFLAVGPTLQVAERSGRVRGGRLRRRSPTPRPKAGVFAVRAGPPLADNLRRRARGAAARDWQPQRRASGADLDRRALRGRVARRRSRPRARGCGP